MLTESEAAVARAVLLHGPISRRALASRLRLSPPSLTRLTRPLLDGGLLVELDDDGDGSVGRPSRPLDIAPSAGTFVGVKLTGDRLHLVATDIRAQVRDRIERPLGDPSPSAVVDAIVAAVADLDRDDLRGVGVSLGGHVDAGVAVDSPFLDWREVPVAHDLAERLGIPVTLENDVVALCEAERWFGLGRGIAGFTVVTIGAGVGFGSIVDGHVVRTRDAGVGTVGHLPLGSAGPTCPRGHRGCAHALLTTTSIARSVSTALDRSVDFDESVELAHSGDPAARAVMDAAADALGALFSLAANLSLQSDIVLAGEGVAVFDLGRERVEAVLARDRPPAASPVSIHVDRSGFSAWARGAAAVAIQAAMGRISLEG